MPWFKVDDTLHSHPKTRRAGLAAMGLWVIAGSYCSQYVTEGFVPNWFVSGQKNGHKIASAIVASGLWEKVTKDGEQGYQFHDWEDFQMTKAEVDADKEHNRERQRRYRAKQREGRRNAVSNAVTNGETNGGSNDPPTQPVPTLPNPTQPTDKEREEVLNGSYLSNAREPEPQLSRSFPSNVVLIANKYTDRVKLSDRSKVCTVVDMALKSGYLSTKIEDALGRLADSGMAVTPDTLRIEIEGRQNFPTNGRASPKQSTADQRVSNALSLAQRLAAEESAAESQTRLEIGR